MTSHDNLSLTNERVLNLATLKALGHQGHFKAVIMNADVTAVSTLEEEIKRDCVVAWAHSRLGDNDVAKDLAKTAYERSLEAFGEDAEVTLIALNDYARFAYRSGDHELGLSLGEVVFQKRRSVLGANNSKTLTSYSNLLEYRYDTGLDVDVKALDDLMKAWGEIDPNKEDAAHLASAMLRANVIQSLASKARAEVISWYIKALGEDHPDTLRAQVSE